MTRSWVAIAMMCGIGAAGWILVPRDGDPATFRTAEPELVFEPHQIDLGDVYTEEECSFSTSLVNRGLSYISIDKVFPGCQCTTFELSEKRIAPGERIDIAGQFRAGPIAGEINSPFSVTAQGGNRAEGKLSARVLPIVVSEPERITLNPDILMRAQHSDRFHLQVAGGDQYTIYDVRCSDDSIAFDVSNPILSPGSTVQILVTVDSGAIAEKDVPIDVHLKRLRDGALRKCTLDARVRPVYALECHPGTINVGVVQRSVLSDKRLHVTISGSLLPHLKFLECTSTGMLLVAESIASQPDSHVISLLYDSSRSDVDLSGEVAIRYRLRDEDVTLLVPITGFLID